MHFPFVCFPLPVCSKDRTRSDILKRSFELKAPWGPGGSSRFPLSFYHAVFLSAPCSSSSSSALFFLFRSTWSVRAPGGCLITLIHTHMRMPTAAAFLVMPHSHSALAGSAYLNALSHIARSCWNISGQKCSPYSRAVLSLLRLLHRIPKPIFFVFEKKDRKALMRGLHKQKLNAVVNLLLCEKLISSFALRKNIFFMVDVRHLSRTASLCLSNSNNIQEEVSS